MQWIHRAGLLLMVLMLGACSGAKPYEYHANLEEPSGPGLFTGADEKESDRSKARE